MSSLLVVVHLIVIIAVFDVIVVVVVFVAVIKVFFVVVKVFIVDVFIWLLFLFLLLLLMLFFCHCCCCCLSKVSPNGPTPISLLLHSTGLVSEAVLPPPLPASLPLAPIDADSFLAGKNVVDVPISSLEAALTPEPLSPEDPTAEEEPFQQHPHHHHHHQLTGAQHPNDR